MTRIDFYTRVPDKLRTACSLAAKACGQGLKVFVFCPDPDTAQRLDRLLWTVPALGFTPHCGPHDALAAVTPVIIDHRGEAPPHEDVLLNLRPEWPPCFSRFQRLLEIVSLDEADRAAARERYRFYRDSGYDIRTHDLGEPAAPS
jgi:DNA polymerase-3 subunit chi